MKKLHFLFIFVLVIKLFAWGPHPQITKAAIETLPELDKWQLIYGKENLSYLGSYCWMPDCINGDRGGYFANDYLINKKITSGILHIYPEVKTGIEYHFKRALQAFKTESYKEAFRHLGPLIHYLEDLGAPPHALPILGGEHSALENWVNGSLIKIKDYYVPKQLGKTEEEAITNLMKECESLRGFSKEIGEKALVFVKENKREQVEPLILKSANKSAEVISDCLYTIFKLAEKYDRKKSIEGKIEFPPVKFHEKKGARVILIDNTKYEGIIALLGEDAWAQILYGSSTEFTTFTDEKGYFDFYNIPYGKYRILSYRIGSKIGISEPFEIREGKIVKIKLTLPPAEPVNNLVLNPDFKLFYSLESIPEYWRKSGNKYFSHPVKLPPDTDFKFGATGVKASVKIEITEDGKLKEIFEIKDEPIKYKTGEKTQVARVVIDTADNLVNAVENVYIAPE